MHHALDRWIPLPIEFDSYGATLRSRLEQVAVAEIFRWNVSCEYLGSKSTHGYEPDPDKWKLQDVEATERLHIKIFFKWTHVYDGPKTYITSVRVNNAAAGSFHRAVAEFNLARALNRKGGEPQRALDLLTSVASVRPSNGDVMFQFGVAYRQMGDMEQARLAYGACDPP